MSTLGDLGVGITMGGSLDLQYDESLHSTLKPSLRHRSEISKFGRPALPSPAVAECFCARGGRALPLCLNGDKSWADCLFGEGVWTAHSPSNQLQSYAETAWLGLGWELGPIFYEGLCESECCHSQQSWLVYSQHQYEHREEGWKARIWPEPACHIWARVHIGLRCSHQWIREDCRVAAPRSCLRFSSLEAAARKLYHMYTDIQQSNCMFLLTVTSRRALHIVFVWNM